MSKQREDKITNLPGQEPEIFGRSKSREEIKAELKAEKAARRVAQKEAYRAQLEKQKNQPKEKRPELWIMAGVMALLFIVCMVLVSTQIAGDTKQAKYQRDTTRETYFLDDEAMPELSEDGITAAVNQVYYTEGGYLCVKMTLGNGLDKDQYMKDLEVQIFDDKETFIAGGFTKNISNKFYVPAQGTESYVFYISPEHVKVTDAPLTSITYSITAGGYTKG